MLEKEIFYYRDHFTIDRCINCKDPKPISDLAFVQYQDGQVEKGPICKDCSSINKIIFQK